MWRQHGKHESSLPQKQRKENEGRENHSKRYFLSNSVSYLWPLFGSLLTTLILTSYFSEFFCLFRGVSNKGMSISHLITRWSVPTAQKSENPEGAGWKLEIVTCTTRFPHNFHLCTQMSRFQDRCENYLYFVVHSFNFNKSYDTHGDKFWHYEWRLLITISFKRSDLNGSWTLITC